MKKRQKGRKGRFTNIAAEKHFLNKQNFMITSQELTGSYMVQNTGNKK
jgi:hypothetical protein